MWMPGFLSGVGLWVNQVTFFLRCSSPQGLKMGVTIVMLIVLSNLTRLSSRACKIVEGMNFVTHVGSW